MQQKSNGEKMSLGWNKLESESCECNYMRRACGKNYSLDREAGFCENVSTYQK